MGGKGDNKRLSHWIVTGREGFEKGGRGVVAPLRQSPRGARKKLGGTCELGETLNGGGNGGTPGMSVHWSSIKTRFKKEKNPTTGNLRSKNDHPEKKKGFTE